MHVTVYGLGSIGAMIATFLQEGNIAGSHQIQLVGRPHVIDPIQKSGLIYIPYNYQSEEKWIRTSGFHTYTSFDGIEATDILILTMKSHALVQNLEKIKEKLQKWKPIVIIMMNGLGLKELVARYVPAENIIETIANYPCHLHENRVENSGGNDVIIAENTPLTQKIFTDLFGKSHLKFELSSEFKKAQWKKAIMNIGMNAMAAMTQLTVGEVLARANLGEIIKALIAESLQIATKEGIILTEDMVKFFWQFAGRDPTHYPSMYFDLEAKKPTEVEFMNGYITKRGKEYNIKTPANDAIFSLIRIIENGYKKGKEEQLSQ
jgi:2-dehydropantoate 2-reductase